MPLVICILLILLLLESTIVSVPLTLVFLICLLVIKKERWVFFLGFFAGILLDLLLARTIGTTAMVIVAILFLLMLYQRKFEIASYYFTAFASGIASFFYVLIFPVPHALFHATMSAIIAILFFSLLKRAVGEKDQPLEAI